MGIFGKPKPTYNYVPPADTPSTLLGRSAQPEAGQFDDLNRAPATSVELRFRRVAFPGWRTTRDHAFIVVTDNATGKQWVHQAGPGGPDGDPLLGSIKVDTDVYDKDARGYNDDYRTVARFSTDTSPESVAKRLATYGNHFENSGASYQLPPDVLAMVPATRQDELSTRNSNYYGGLVWQNLTGKVPKLPSDMDAPGWGDHTRDPSGAIP